MSVQAVCCAVGGTVVTADSPADSCLCSERGCELNTATDRRYRVRMKRVEAQRAKQVEQEQQQQLQQQAKVEKKKLKDKEWRKNKRQQLKDVVKNKIPDGEAPVESSAGQKRKVPICSSILCFKHLHECRLKLGYPCGDHLWLCFS